MASPIIEIEALCKRFPTKHGALDALQDINLSVGQGEIFGIIGMSGAGKSTLVRCINFLERPDSGTVRVDGTDLAGCSPSQLREKRRQIGMVFQQFNLLMQKNVLQNVCFPLRLRKDGRREAQDRAMELLRMVGLEDKAQAYPAQLSGGQRQRVAIARALAAGPKILLCDEATSALDNATAREIMALLRQINQRLGVTILTITHQLSVIDELCHRVAVLDGGRLVETTTAEELFLRPRSDAAKRLVLGEKGSKVPELAGSDRVYRIVFNGSTSRQPVLAGMILACGQPVNIYHAELQEIDGKNYGQMVIGLPGAPAARDKALGFLQAQHIVCEPVTRKEPVC